MNKIKCPCGDYVYFDGTSLSTKRIFKDQHRDHLWNGAKFKVYPSELLQIARNMTDNNEDD